MLSEPRAGDAAILGADAAGASWAGGKGNLLIAIGAVVLTAAFAMLALHVEDQWVLGGVLAGGLAASVLAGRSGLTQRASAGFAGHNGVMNMVVTLALLATVFVFREDHFNLLMLASLLLFTVVCLGLNIQIGYCGVVNFAGAAFFGVGSYTAAVLIAHTQLPHLLVLLAGGVAAALVGSLLLMPVLRTRGHYAALVTIAFGILFRSFMEVNDTLGGPQGLKIPGMEIFGWSLKEGYEWGDSTISFYVNYVLAAAVLAALAMAITRRIERSWIGLNFDAVRIDEISASTFGINIRRWKITAFMIGNTFAGVAGAFFATMTGFIAPANFTFGDSLILLSIIVMGGLGNPWGIVPAAAIVLLLPEKLQAIQEYRFLLYAIAVILILLFRPDGLFPRGLRNYIPGWRAK
jgi:ABC-type branched-subunit amino acid transport system permease subunit